MFLHRKSKVFEFCFKDCTSTSTYLSTLGDTIFRPASLNGNLLISGCLAAQIIILQVCEPCLANHPVYARVHKMSVLSCAQNIGKPLSV